MKAAIKMLIVMALLISLPANLDLSKRRGAAVKNELVKTFGIDASRIESDGMGESKPVASNDTPSN